MVTAPLLFLVVLSHTDLVGLFDGVVVELVLHLVLLFQADLGRFD